MVEMNQYYEAIITESLSIDMESYELLKANAFDVCKEDSLDFREPAFHSLFIDLIMSRKIIPCLYDQQQKAWHEEEFNPQDLLNYWFKLGKK